MSTVINEIILGGSNEFNIATIAPTYAYWRADRPNTLSIDASNKVVVWKDWLGDSSKDWIQSTSGSAPIWNPAKAATGKPALDFVTAAQLFMQNSMTRSASDMSVWFMVDRGSTTAVQDIFTTQTGLLVLASVSSTSSFTGYYDTAWRQGSNSVTGTQALGFQFSGTGGSAGTVYRSMTSLGSFSYASARAIGGTSAIGAYFDGSAQWYDGCIYEMIIYNSALTIGQRTELLTYWGNKYRFDINA